MDNPHLSYKEEELLKNKKKTASPPAPFRQFTDLFCRLWQEKHGTKYPFTRKDGTNAARIWAAVEHDLGQAERTFRAYLDDGNRFYEGHALALLSSSGVLPKFLALAVKAATQESERPLYRPMPSATELQKTSKPC